MSRKPTLSSEKPANKRVKVTLACIVCRKKKIKCDGIQPTCSRCQANDATCEYTDPPRKRGPPKGSVEVIESRAQRIKSLLDKDMRASAAYLPVNPVRPCSMNTILRVISEAAEATPHFSLGSYNMAGDFQCGYNEPVPSELSLVWTEHFFDHFNLFFPVLSRHHFLHQLRNAPYEMDGLLRYAVLALGCLYMHPKDQYGHQLFRKCQCIASTRPGPTLSTLQALVIMCWHAYLTGNMHQCCIVRHQVAHAIDRLHLSADILASLPTVEAEMWKRVLWVAYVIDQWLTAVTGDSVLPVHTGHWRCQWPSLEDHQLCALDGTPLDFQTSNSDPTLQGRMLQISGFSETIKLTQILGQVHESTNVSQVVPHTQAFVEASLAEWMFNLPACFEYGRSDDGSTLSLMSKIYHLLYYTTRIMLQWPRQGQPVEVIKDQCGMSASAIVYIAEQMLHQGQHKWLYNLFGLSLTLATDVHLQCTKSNHCPADNYLCKSVAVLRGANCSLLSPMDLDRALDRFFVEQRNIFLPDVFSATTPQQVRLSTDADLLSCPVYEHAFQPAPLCVDLPIKYDNDGASWSSASKEALTPLSTPVESLHSSPISYFPYSSSSPITHDDSHLYAFAPKDFTPPVHYTFV